MPTIRFSIGTQSFTLACEEGQEPHIRKLEKSVNTRFENMQRTFGSAGNQLVMAVTMLMMEEDLQKKQPSKSAAEVQISDISNQASTEVDVESLRKQIRAEILEELAPRLETLAESIETV